MVDNELKSYINGLMKQGYDIDTIRDTLVKAGHDLTKVEKISASVFENLHKDLLEYIDKEIAKDKGIDQIKKELMDLGHSEKKLSQVISYKRKTVPLHKKHLFSELLHREKIWFKSWIKVYMVLFIVILVLSLVILTVTLNIEVHMKPKNFEERMELCSKISDQMIMTSCMSYLANTDHCSSLSYESEVDSCNDMLNLFKYYSAGKSSSCLDVKNPSIKEYCLQVSEGSCNNYFGLGDYCKSIVEDGTSYCLDDDSILGISCIDNYYLYSSISMNDDLCSKIHSKDVSKLCLSIS
ncbi:hypothetical protein H6503_04545 [Candidatus Woesearchaeota archaeon]|nr:hypothetical protein [Candidatus Woesearchaeota archaeon]